MVSKDIISEIFNNILNESSFKGNLNTKCRPPIDEIAYGKLKTNEETAKFFGLEYLPDGRPDMDNYGDNNNVAFYDKRNHCMLVFFTENERKLRGADFSNNHINGDDSDGYIANLKDILRAYYEAPYILKKATWLLQFEAGNGDFVGGDCNMYGVNMYNACLFGDVRETMYHEMSHALAFQSIDWRNGEKLVVDQLPDALKDKWDSAAQKDYEFQKKNNLPHQDTSEYGETNPNEDFAEMGSVISSKLSRNSYNLTSSYRVYEADETRPSGRRFSHIMTVDEIINANPNRSKLMMEIMKDTKSIDTNNKRDYMNTFYEDMADMFDEEPMESW